MRGAELEIGGEDPQDRLVKGFQVLVDKVYTSLPVLRGATYTEADLGRAGRVDGGLFGGEGSGLTEAEQETALGKKLYQSLNEPGITLGEALVKAKQSLLTEKPTYRSVVQSWSLLGDPGLGLAFSGGLILGHLAQEVVHFHLHQPEPCREGWLRRRWRHHHFHHHVDERRAFGTLGGAWDRLLGTGQG